MITIKLEKYLSLDKANAILVKYTRPRVSSYEDFNGSIMYSKCSMVQFDDDNEAMMFMIEVSDYQPVVTDKKFKAGHIPF